MCSYNTALKKKVCVIYFGSLSKHPDKLHLWFGNEIVKKFAIENTLEKVYCLEADGLGVDVSKVQEFSGSFYSKTAHGITMALKYVLPVWSRKVMEFFFGIFILSDLDYSKVDIFLFLRATNKNISLKAKSNNKKVIGMISIFPRSLVNEEIKKQEKKWSIVEKSDYTSKRRIREFDQILASWDIIIPWTNTEVVKSLLNAFPFAPKVKYTNHEYSVNENVFFFHEMPSLEKVHFLAVTDGTLKKGILELLVTWQQFSKASKREASLTVVGKLGEEIPSVLKRMTDLKNVRFVGYVNDVHNYMKNAHVFICSSVIDMGPRTIKQAMKMGRMVIASNLCGHSACIQHFEEGLVYDPSNLDTLLDCLLWTEKNYKKIPSIGKAASKKADSFIDQNFANDVYDIVTGQ